MTIAEAQKEIRLHFAGGFYGQCVSSVLWALSAVLATVASPGLAMIVLVFGGFLLFPLTKLLTQLAHTPPLTKTNELNWLGMQIAFILPISMLLLVPVVRYNPNLFYPGLMILLGAHYIPFVFLYGMKAYACLASLLACGGVLFALRFSSHFTIGAWYTAAVLFVFALVVKRGIARERKAEGSTPC